MSDTTLRPPASAPPASQRALDVCYLIDSLGPGGAERLLLDYLPHLRREGIAVRVATLGEREGNPTADALAALDVPVDLLPTRRLLDPAGTLRIHRYLRTRRPDVVHTQLERADSIGALAARAAGLPVVSTQHLLAEPRGRSRAELRNALAERMLRASGARIVAVSDAARETYVAHTALPESRLVTIRNGIDVEAFQDAMEDRDRMRAELGVPDAGPVIASVAVLRPGKGIEIMLRALPRVIEEFPDAAYVIAGDGSERPGLEALARELGVDGAVRFLGTRRDVARVLSAADLFVHPTFADALPTTLAEAMAAGLPIVASAVGGVPEMLPDQRNGLLVRPGEVGGLSDAVTRILRDGALAERMAEQAASVLRERFDLARQAAALANLYRAAREGRA